LEGPTGNSESRKHNTNKNALHKPNAKHKNSPRELNKTFPLFPPLELIKLQKPRRKPRKYNFNKKKKKHNAKQKN
jgi:hypothetical protein